MTNIMEVLRGADFVLTGTVKDSTGTVIDITDYTVLFTVKCQSNTNSSDSNAVILKDNVPITDATNGQFTLTLTNDDTKIPYGDYIFGFKLKDDSGNFIPSYNGIYKCVKVATNREV